MNASGSFNGTIKVYGTRSLASDPAGDPASTYISVRRLVNFLRSSIDAGTQWAVFEPNAQDLWWKNPRTSPRSSTASRAAAALVGATPEQAFYVRCDDIANPADVRAQGQVVTEIGVALVHPAEFVIFRLSQWACRRSRSRRR